MTYAIIELGGKQYRVEEGDSVLVDRLDAKEGAKVAPRPLLYSGGEKTVLDGPELDKVKVEAVVAEHVKGEKIRVFKYRAKKRYRRRAGHRSLLTRLEINQIQGPTSRAAPAKGAAKAGDAGEERRAPAKKKDEKNDNDDAGRVQKTKPRERTSAAKKAESKES